MIPSFFWYVPTASAIALFTALILFLKMKKEPMGNDTMIKIASHVRKGAMSYLKQQYKITGIVFIFLAILFAISSYVFKAQNEWVWFAFITGGFFSGLCGYIGMNAATHANVRVTNAARTSLNKALKIAIRSGAIMGLVVVGFALLDISIWFLILNYFIEGNEGIKLILMTTIMITFGMGASTQALLARVGGGIFTKAADISADLVGKIEEGIPEDDPRNPATIADNVGDNVGDNNGLGADLYESYVGSILATAALGAAAYYKVNTHTQLQHIILPMLIAAFGIIFSILAVLIIKVKEDADVKDIVKSMHSSMLLTSILTCISGFLITYLLGIKNWIELGVCILLGLIGGVVIGETTNYYTSYSHSPTKKVAESAKTSTATLIISGLALGMKSTVFSILSICGVMFFSYYIASGFNFENISEGLYGIGVSSVGMLATLGLTLAMDAFGPIVDNAGGNAEMSKLPESVRKNTDKLDSAGNITAATGKGFAIGSAALTAMALFATYLEEIKISLIRSGESIINISGTQINIIDTNILNLMNYYKVHLMNPNVIVGIFIGSMMVFVFTATLLRAVENTSVKMIKEIRRQFKDKDILDGKKDPDYERCIIIATKGAQIAMILPATLAIVVPIATGIIFGVSGVMGLLMGGLATCIPFAIFMSSSGGAWDNAKKYIESGKYGGKGSDAHKAAVVGDTVGDPLKDTCGPAMDILIKLMSMVAIVTAGYHINPIF